MNILKNIKKVLAGAAAVALVSVTMLSGTASAATFSVSPTHQKIFLTPGQIFYGTLTVANPASSQSDLNYTVSVAPFGVDKNYKVTHEASETYSQIVDWIKLYRESGKLTPNSTEEVEFSITVPNDAPAGGQYASILVTTANSKDDADGIVLNENIQFAHLIYAEVAGQSVYDGVITEASVPSFMFDGEISGTATVQNTGNVHLDATYTLQVFPAFSDEEIYTNEEDPMTNIIVPDSTRTTTTWAKGTPNMGIFRVVYTVEFNGVTRKVEKVVIKCPIWLLFVIVFIIAGIIVYIVARTRARKK